MSVSEPEIAATETVVILTMSDVESSAVIDGSATEQDNVSPTADRTEIVMDLSMKKKKKVNSSKEPAEQATAAGAGDAVKVEMIPSAFEVKISELIINADKKQTEINEGGCDTTLTERKLATTQRPKRAKKRKQAPEKIIQGCKVSDYVTASTQQQDLPTTEIVIETTAADNDGLITKGSNGEDTVNLVETILEVETSKPVIVEEEQEDGVSLPLKVPTVTVTTSSTSEIDSPVTTATEIHLSQLQSSLFNSSILGSNSKPMRPFKLYTQNRDLLAGIGLNQSNMDTLAAALSGRPLTSSTIVGSTASLPITAFAPLNLKNPLIPTTIPTGVPETTVSQVGSTAGSTDGKLLSAATSVITSTTSSAMRLMTLATAADKILKGKKEEQSDSHEKDANVPLIIAASDGSSSTLGHINEDGTIELTLDATSPERMALIQQQFAMTPSSDSDEPKSKKSKKRLQLPDTMKTPNYWERRRKNNEAAKRSRDARRAKEDQIAIRAAILEHENTRLKIELKALKEETAKLRAEIYERKQSDPK